MTRKATRGDYLFVIVVPFLLLGLSCCCFGALFDDEGNEATKTGTEAAPTPAPTTTDAVTETTGEAPKADSEASTQAFLSGGLIAHHVAGHTQQMVVNASPITRKWKRWTTKYTGERLQHWVPKEAVILMGPNWIDFPTDRLRQILKRAGFRRTLPDDRYRVSLSSSEDSSPNWGLSAGDGIKRDAPLAGRHQYQWVDGKFGELMIYTKDCDGMLCVHQIRYETAL